ncbi:proline-rich protein PRCC-like [Homarus americanus]|uniref:proline-rich protein PRCC-like n=1 Tax=Homarus americanus TaxID=6706 RepID=UPI001C46E929|nr:proline-rich protein PRCC-like [Homarus americanus]
MALVAYSDDSDLGSDSEDGEEHLESSIEKELKPQVTNNGVNGTPFSQVKSNSGQPNLVLDSGVDSIVDEDDNIEVKKTGLLASIPAAKPLTSIGDGVEIGEEADELTDVPTVDTWKVIQELKSSSSSNEMNRSSSSTSVSSKIKKEKRKVQIFVPALSEFADDEDEDEQQEPERKKLKPSSTGTGLFSLLPEPKHLSVKETKRSLVPHILTKKSVPVQSRPKPKSQPRNTTTVGGNDSDDEGNAGPSDFFSLSESASETVATNKIPAAVASVPEVDPITRKPPVIQTSGECKALPREHTVCSEDYSNTPHYPSVQSQEEVYYPPQDVEMFSGSQTAIDDEAMLRLAGKRRGKGEAINFIDVSADDALLTRDEWMTKALTEEKPCHSFSKKREGLPSQKQKQKHQITYLAHQAKERELELKNSWAQNRMTKMQTQAKYGF